jgi:thiosulfate/3-mercaptopyruvate sulfurtransferase
VSNLVSTAWLADHLYTDDLFILDCSWHLPTAKRNAREEFEAAHILGAQFFDIDAVSDTETTLPHMLPTPEKFAREVSKLGVTNSSKVICYDSVGLFSAARVWWMFKVFGHDNVAVLDGGLKKWLVEERPNKSGVALPKGGSFSSSFHHHMVKSITQVAGETAQIIDARSPTRFRGEEPEPRPGVKPGHMPGAKNIHYATLLNADGTMKSRAELAQIFASFGIESEKLIITSCGSGITAAILTLALTELSAKHHALYDGSWAEWGASAQEIELG